MDKDIHATTFALVKCEYQIHIEFEIFKTYRILTIMFYPIIVALPINGIQKPWYRTTIEHFTKINDVALI